MRLMLYPTALFLTLLTLAGCATEAVEGEPPLSFCDAEEERRFSQEEIDWRSANAPWNLRRDFKTNETGERECGWFQS